MMIATTMAIPATMMNIYICCIDIWSIHNMSAYDAKFCTRKLVLDVVQTSIWTCP